MTLPKISIITASYNSEKTIEDTVRSVVNQSYPNLEYIIVDGKSRDRTLQVIEKHKSRVAHIISEKDDGIYFAFNRGVALATGDYVGILNSDDFYVDDSVLQHVVDAFSGPQVDAVYGDLVFVDPVDTRKVVRYWKSCEYSKESFRRGWMPPHPTFFVKRELYQKFGLFSTRLKVANDYELMLRFLYKNGANAKYIPKILIKMRVGGVSNGSVKKYLTTNVEDMDAWRMNGISPSLLTNALKRVRKLNQFIVPTHVRKAMASCW